MTVPIEVVVENSGVEITVEVTGPPGPDGPEGPAGGVPEAPIDGEQYARKDAGWEIVTGGGAVDSVNGQTGVVVLDATDIGADPTGTAANAQADAETYADGILTAHVLGADPHPLYLTEAEHDVLDHSGIPGTQGPPGGSMLSGWWTFNATTSGPAPAGQVRASVATANPGDTITVWLNSVDADGLDWSLVSAQVGQQLILRSASGETWTTEITAIPGNTAITCQLISATTSAPKRNENVQVSLVTAPATGGGGAVDSVNGQTGVVVLDASDVGAATAAQGALADTAVQPAVTDALDSRVTALESAGAAGLIVLDPAELVPGGTAVDTVIVRR